MLPDIRLIVINNTEYAQVSPLDNSAQMFLQGKQHKK